jgi:plasmid stability protein
MAQVLVEDLDPVVIAKLEALAAKNGRSLQAELKYILEAAVRASSLNQSEEKAATTTPEELGWRTGFFEKTAGKWQGEPLTRGEQGEYDQRLWELM